MSVFSHPDFDHHELVAFKEDPATGLKAIIAVHNSHLGPATGGCRMFPYASSDDALSDVLRLSRGMTYKSALAGIALGGGKSVIIGNAQQDKTRELMLAMGDFIESQSGHYISAEDSGTNVSDMAVIAEKTAHVSGLSDDPEYGGDPSPTTAYGVYKGICAAVDFQLGSDLQGVRIALQGIGSVGYYLAQYLREAGAQVFAADVNRQNIDRAVENLGVVEIALNDVLSADVDVLSPCAMGGAININTIDNVKAKVIAGAANNQLATLAMGDALMEKGILYAPDYVINAGGIIDVFYQQAGNRSAAVVREHVNNIGDTLSAIFQRSKQESTATSSIADLMAEEIFSHPENRKKNANRTGTSTDTSNDKKNNSQAA